VTKNNTVTFTDEPSIEYTEPPKEWPNIKNESYNEN